MAVLLPGLKRSLRTSLTYGKTVLRGYPLHYARTQIPVVTADYPYIWSEFITPIPQRPGSDAINESRLWNLKLAVSHIHGLVLQPQQIFGFWNRVPRPTLKNQFREGPVFVRGRIQTDVGGGLCLISTNLFNTFLTAGLQILERHNHSIDPYGDRRFFPQGRDATVYHGYKDLIVRNTSTVPLQIRIQVLPDDQQVISSIAGLQPCPQQIKIESDVLEVLPAPSDAGMPGYRVQTTRWMSDRYRDAAGAMSWQQDYLTLSVYEPCCYAYY